MPSQRQIAANRLNAQKSTGPRTPEGKARSSRNALKHGVHSRRLTFTTDDVLGLRASLAAHRAEFRPVGPREHAVVLQIAVAEWGCRRQRSAETALFNQPSAADDVDPFLRNLSALNHLTRVESRFHRLYLRALNNLHRLQKSRRRREKHNNDKTNPIAPPLPDSPDPPVDASPALRYE